MTTSLRPSQMEVLRWQKRKLSDGVRVYEADGYRIEPDWVWSARKGGRVHDGWAAFRGGGPTRVWIGSFDKLSEAKDACAGGEGR